MDYTKLSYVELEKLLEQTELALSDIKTELARKEQEEMQRDWNTMVEAINSYTDKWGFIYASNIADSCFGVRHG